MSQPTEADAPAEPRSRRWLVVLQIVVIAATVAVVAVVSARGADNASTAAPGPAGSSQMPAATASASSWEISGYGAFEQRQLELSQAKLTGVLGEFAQPWLPWIALCDSSRDPDGPQLRDGEVTRVVCWYGNIALYFIEYASVDDRDRYRDLALGDNSTAATLAPGAGLPGARSSTSGTTTGMYIEYAYRVATTGEDAVISGLWWDDGDRPVAGYLLAFWDADLGESWAPLRDVWRQHS